MLTEKKIKTKIAFLITLLVLSADILMATTYVFTGAEDSLYINVNNWQNQLIAPDPITVSDTVIIAAGVECWAESSILNSGTFINRGNFKQPISTIIIWHQGVFHNQAGAHFNSNFVQMSDTGTFNNAENAVFENTAQYSARSSTFNNWGTIQNKSGAEFLNKNPNRPVPTLLNNYGSFENESGAYFENLGSYVNQGIFDNRSGSLFESYGSFVNQGSFENRPGALAITQTITNEGIFNNHDSLIVSMSIDNSGNFNNHAVVTASSTNAKISNYSMLKNFTGGELQLGLENHDNGTVENQAIFIINAFLNDPSAIINNTGSIINDGSLGGILENLGEIVNNGYVSFAPRGCINQGTISGNGTFGPGLVFTDGCIKPGSSIGHLALEGNFQACYESCKDRYVAEIGGEKLNDTISSAGEAQLGGILEIELIDNFLPDRCQQFVILTYDSLSPFSNSFDSLIMPDISPYTWELTYTNTAVLIEVIPEAQNNALSFDGINDYISLDSDLDAVHTIEFLFKPIKIEPGFSGDPLFNFNSNPTQWIWTMDVTSNVSYETLSIQHGGSFGNNLLYTKYKFTHDWYHVAIVSDGQFYKKIYINGSEVPTFTGTGGTYPQVFLATSFLIGARLATSSYFRGDLEEVRLWSTIRSPEEIRNSYLRDLNETEVGLAAYYKMNQGVAGGDHSMCNLFSFLDSGPLQRHGVMHGFDFVGSTSNWVRGCTVEENIFTRKFDNSWYDPLNWSLGTIPQICHRVIIPAGENVSLDGYFPARCHTLEVAGTAELTMMQYVELEVLARGL